MSPKGLAILGSGIFAKEAHLPAVASLAPGVTTLRAVYSRSQKSASELAAAAQDKLGYTPDVYFDGSDADLDKLLAREDVDAVAVALPITVQPDIVRRALKAGKHVLSEKPVAPDVASGLALIGEYEEKYRPKGLVWRVAENWEVEPGYHAAAKMVKEGKIGKLDSFTVRSVGHVPKDSKWYNTPWRTVPDYQGGFLLDGGVHTAAALRILLPRLTSLSGHTTQNQPHLPPADTLHALVSTADGAHGLVELSWGAPVPSLAEQTQGGMTITGRDGWIAISSTNDKLKITLHTVVRDEKGRDTGEKEEVVEEPKCGVSAEFARFFKAVEGEDDGFGTPRGALQDVAFIEAALESKGRPVDLIKLVEG